MYWTVTPPRRLLGAFAGVLLALAVVPSAATAAEPGVTPLNLSGGTAVDEPAQIAKALNGAGWVRMFADWKQVVAAPGEELGEMNGRVDAFRRNGQKIVMAVQAPPAGIDMDTAAGVSAYADFMGSLAKEFAGRVAVWELWNEPDGTFWTGDGSATPAHYAAMLKATYPAIKAQDPGATVIVGGLVGHDFDFVEGLYDNGAGPYFDGVGVHTDTACRIDAPGVVYREESGRIGRFAFTGYREVHATMERHGDGAKGIWMTEIGWNDAADLTCDEGANQGTRAKGVSAADQAKFLKQAFACVAPDPYVKLMSWFTLQDGVASSRFGLFDAAGTIRPAFAALQSVRPDGMGAGSDPGCGAKVDADDPTVTISAPSLYFTRFVTSGTASDPTTSVRKIELWADGKKVMGQDGGKFSYDWFGSSKIGYGAHKVQLRAYDEAGNVGVAETTVTRGNPTSAPRTIAAALGLKVKKKRNRFLVTGTVKPPADGTFTEQPHGRLELRFERKTGGRWKRSRVRKGIGDGGVHYTYTARKRGKWRVYAVLVADAPYRATKTKVFTFKV
jgi:hypothetical protein